jgi:hypothetical protein
MLEYAVVVDETAITILMEIGGMNKSNTEYYRADLERRIADYIRGEVQLFSAIHSPAHVDQVMVDMRFIGIDNSHCTVVVELER